MSTLNILPYFPFNRIRITKQDVISDSWISIITEMPDKQYFPVCCKCGNKSQHIHRHENRLIRGLHLGSFRV